MKRDELPRNEWVVVLANSVNPDWIERSTTALVGMLPFLTGLPDEVFTLSAVREIAERMERPGTPPLGMVLSVLESRQQLAVIEHKRRLELADPRLAGWTNSDHVALSTWQNWRDNNFQTGTYSWVNALPDAERRQEYLRQLKDSSEAAWRFVTEHGDPESQDFPHPRQLPGCF